MKKIFGAFLVLALLLCSSTAFAAEINNLDDRPDTPNYDNPEAIGEPSVDEAPLGDFQLAELYNH